MPDDKQKIVTTVAAAREATIQTEQEAQKEQQEVEEIRQKLIKAQTAELERKNVTEKTTNYDMIKLTSDVQRDLLFEIIMSLRHKLITVGGGRRLAKDFLALFPIQTKEEIIEKMKNLSEKYPEARAVYLKYAVPHQDQIEKELLNQISQHIQSGNIDQALNVAKGGS